MPETVGAREAIIRILRDQKACIAHELSDRAYQTFKLKYYQVKDARDELLSKDVLDRKTLPSPY